jgi:hypothetical protein
MNIEHRSDISPSLGDSLDYLSMHLGELQRHHAGQWVALAGPAVKLFSADLDELQQRILATCPTDTLLIDYIPHPGEGLDWK